MATIASNSSASTNGQFETIRVSTPAAAAADQVLSLRHTLEFEKPLASLEQQIKALEAVQASKNVDYSAELQQLRLNYTAVLRKTYDNLTAWETVQVARHPQRPLFRDYLEAICPGAEFRELHGDRYFGDDNAIVLRLRANWHAQGDVDRPPQGTEYQGKD